MAVPVFALMKEKTGVAFFIIFLLLALVGFLNVRTLKIQQNFAEQVELQGSLATESGAVAENSATARDGAAVENDVATENAAVAENDVATENGSVAENDVATENGAVAKSSVVSDSSEITTGSLAAAVQGKIYDIEQRENGVRLYIYAENINIQSGYETGPAYSGKTRMLLYTEAEDELYMGEEILVKAQVSRPEVSTNPGAFDARSYYSSKGIYLIGKNAVITEKGENYNYLKQFLYRVKTKFASVTDRVFDEENASVVKAMLLGEKSSVDKDVKRLFQQNGIAHILAISGLHIAILGMSLFKLLRRLTGSYIGAGITAIGVIVMYGVMTGMANSTFRAVVMMIITVVATAIGRSSDMLTSAAVALVIQALVNPVVIMDCGFLLSFAAVTGMATAVPGLQFIFAAKHKLSKSLLVSLGVSISTTPLIVYYYYQFPLYGVLLNLIVVPLMTFVILFSILALLFGAVVPVVGEMLALPVRGILWLYKALMYVCGKLPGHNVNVGHISISMVSVFYVSVGILLLVLCALKKGEVSRKEKMMAVVIGILTAIASSIFEISVMDRGFKVVFMDVGQGDGILVRSDMGVNILIDGGSTSNDSVGEYVMTPVLRYYGASHINYAFLSHGDKDHVSGIEYILETDNLDITIDNLVIPAYGALEDFAEIIQLAKQNGVNVIYIEAGDVLTKNDSFDIECLYPFEETEIEDGNELSAVLKFNAYGHSMLFVGDLGFEGEDKILESGIDLESELLKVGHHGSRYSSSDEFLESVKPDISVISAGRNNMYGHPTEETLNRLSDVDTEIYCTKTQGTICVEVGEYLSVENYIGGWIKN